MTKQLRTQPAVVSNPATSDKQELEASQGQHAPVKSETTHPVRGQVKYGHNHSQTSERYQQRRAEFEMRKRMHADEPEQAAAAAEPAQAEQPQQAAAESSAETSAPERVKELALEAVQSVVDAAKEAVHGHPIAGARKLASDAVAGALKVAREVTNRSGGKH